MADTPMTDAINKQLQVAAELYRFEARYLILSSEQLRWLCVEQGVITMTMFAPLDTGRAIEVIIPEPFTQTWQFMRTMASHPYIVGAPVTATTLILFGSTTNGLAYHRITLDADTHAGDDFPGDTQTGGENA